MTYSDVNQGTERLVAGRQVLRPGVSLNDALSLLRARTGRLLLRRRRRPVRRVRVVLDLVAPPAQHLQQKTIGYFLLASCRNEQQIISV